MSELVVSSASLEHQRQLREHPCAPRFNFESSDLLTRETLADVKGFEATEFSKPFWKPGEIPEWMSAYLQWVYREVPFYRDYGVAPRDFEAIPFLSRNELKEMPELLIPDSAEAEELTVYTTSGTTGTSIAVPTDAAVTSKVLVLMNRILGSFGQQLVRGPGKLAVAAVFCQKQTLTYPCLSHYLDGASALKVNLHPDNWREPGHPADYLAEFSPQVITGCPFSLQRLSELAPRLRPALVMSSAEALSDGLREQMQETFQCPVVDVYSLTECKFIAADFHGDGHDLLSPDLYVEIVNEEGRTVPAGEFGEIVVTGGRNRFLPLLRYRTGDYAALRYRGRQPYLVDFQGRAPVRYRDGEGREITSLDVTQALRSFPIAAFSFTQEKDGTYRLDFCGSVPEESLRQCLADTLGLSGLVRHRPEWSGKAQQFS